MIKKLNVLLFVLILFSSGVSAQTKQRVRFARGSSHATVSGTIRGYAFRDYVVGARNGQTISVKLNSRNTFTVLTIFKPNGDNLEGAAEREEFTGELPVSGDYVIRVGMMRAEARRPKSAAGYSLRITIR